MDFQHLTIVLGGEGIDASGRLWLSPSQSPDDWLRIILATDMSEMRRRKAEWETVQSKEKSVSQSMGIGMIYTSGDLHMQTSYGRFLDVWQKRGDVAIDACV